MRISRFASTLVVAAVADCAEPGVGRSHQALISDAFHNNGAAGFAFLPPMAPESRPGDIVPEVLSSVTVRIDELDASDVVRRTLATFTAVGGPRSERIRAHATGTPDLEGDPDPSGYFRARWHTRRGELPLTSKYRTRVFVPARGGGTRELGVADVQLVARVRDLSGVDVTRFVPLVEGSTLDIKFRIDRPAVDRDGDGAFDWTDNCPSLANPDQLDSVGNGVGDACRCLPVTCTAADACHAVGVCQPVTGTCTRPPLLDGTACPLPHAAAACRAGACALDACAAGFGDCDRATATGCETDLRTVTDCAGCGVRCAGGDHASPVCASGRCGLSCDVGFADCDGVAANGCEQQTSTDLLHCGGCNNACTQGRGCQMGACTTAVCQADRADCNGQPGDGCEVTPATDANHCGACGHACALAHAAAVCAGGACVVAACDVAWADCDASPSTGCEQDIASSVANCGACGRACAVAHATPSCAAGVCGIASCDAGHANCDGSAADGCEIDLRSDALHCGACGNRCVVPHATARCAGGGCGIAACDPGFADCDGDAGNGCEADLAGVANCGACGVSCGARHHATPTCGPGCGFVCETGYADCDGDASNGCEALLAGDRLHCGACGNACTQGRGCQAGACTTAVCAAGRGDCNALPGDGCEVDLSIDVTNCGACARGCSFPGAVAECTGGVCGFSACAPGRADCDGAAANGCEVDLARDGDHCGGCGRACGTGGYCSGGACGACGRSSANCDGAGANFCETSLDTLNNCGACGRTCAPAGPHMTASCGSGTCVSACEPGWAACDADGANGCETQLGTLDNCAFCGHDCNYQNTSGYPCVPSISVGSFRCDPLCPYRHDFCGGRACRPLVETFEDHDLDGWGNARVSTEYRCGASPGHALTAGDCDDRNAAVHPGEAGWHTTPYDTLVPFFDGYTAVRSYDYDCSGTAEGYWGGNAYSVGGEPHVRPPQGFCMLAPGLTCLYVPGWANADAITCGTGSPYISGCSQSGLICTPHYSSSGMWGCH